MLMLRFLETLEVPDLYVELRFGSPCSLLWRNLELSCSSKLYFEMENRGSLLSIEYLLE